MIPGKYYWTVGFGEDMPGAEGKTLSLPLQQGTATYYCLLSVSKEDFSLIVF